VGVLASGIQLSPPFLSEKLVKLSWPYETLLTHHDFWLFFSVGHSCKVTRDLVWSAHSGVVQKCRRRRHLFKNIEDDVIGQ